MVYLTSEYHDILVYTSPHSHTHSVLCHDFLRETTPGLGSDSVWPYVRKKEKNTCPKGILPSDRPLHTKQGDGGWMGKLTPGLGRVSGLSWPITRSHVGLRLVWETIGRCFPLDDRRALDVCSWRRKHVVAYSPRTRIFCEVLTVDS
jgi:hypothetical protein